MKLQIGQEAPLIKATDHRGNPINLESLKGKKVLLSFFRGASCPFCNLRMHKLINEHQRLTDEGLVIIALYTSGLEKIKKFVGKQNPPFSIIPDEDLTFHQDYLVERSFFKGLKALFRFKSFAEIRKLGLQNFDASKDDNLVPADFLIDEDLNIAKAYYGSDYGDHIPMSEIYNWLKTSNVIAA